MNQAYHQYLLRSSVDANILIAFLADFGFEAFQETEAGLLAFRLAEEHQRATTDLADLQQQFPFTYEWEAMPDKNWNAIWESQFTPIRVGNRLGIRAAFHPPLTGVAMELIIDPKMAFGTGHHATTYMVSDLMFEYEMTNKIVLDYGCGTGILAILAKRLGAGTTWAVDIEFPSYENTLENATTNGVSLDKVVHGTLENIDSSQKFDIVLANINRNVILDSLASLYERLAVGGWLFISGILEKDRELIDTAARQQGFTPLENRQREGWLAWVFQR